MYTVAVARDLNAQHYLIGGDWGAENLPHSHHYRIEVQLQGNSLDEHNFLVDIVEIEKYLDQLVIYYQEQTLNNLPEFANVNPSIEHFAHVLCQQIAAHLHTPRLQQIAVKIWEEELAWAACQISV